MTPVQDTAPFLRATFQAQAAAARHSAELRAAPFGETLGCRLPADGPNPALALQHPALAFRNACSFSLEPSYTNIYIYICVYICLLFSGEPKNGLSGQFEGNPSSLLWVAQGAGALCSGFPKQDFTENRIGQPSFFAVHFVQHQFSGVVGARISSGTHPADKASSCGCCEIILVFGLDGCEIHFAPRGKRGKPVLVDICRGIAIPGVLRWWGILSIHRMEVTHHVQTGVYAALQAHIGCI